MGGCPGHCGVLGSTLASSHQKPITSPSSVVIKMCPKTAMCPLGQTRPQVRISSLDASGIAWP